MENIFLEMSEVPVPEVKEAMDFIQHKLENHKGRFHLSPNDINWKILVFHQEDEWVICSNYEDGFHSTIFRNGEWFYRCPWDGLDTKIRDDGVLSRIADHWLSYYTVVGC